MPATVPSDELAFAGLAGQARRVRDGEVSPSDLVELCLSRIERLDPELNAFRVVFADRARVEAKQAEGRRGAGEERPLLGVPIAIKDDQDVAGERTMLGTDAVVTPAPADAELVARLRAAGAIVIGKTNVPELCMLPWTESKTHGITRNPWDRDRTPGGSSGGTAAAVAAGLVPAGTGSDGGGSIRIPAACCGIFGIKPQRGRVPLAPLTDEWHGLSAFGPLARGVADAALMLDVMAGTGETFAAAAGRPPGKLRIGLSFKWPVGINARLEPEIRAAIERCGEVLRSLGHEVVPREPAYGALYTGFLPRYFHGIALDEARMERRDRLERRTRSFARLGRALGPLVGRAVATEPAIAAKANAVFDDVDVLLSPVMSRTALQVSEHEGRFFFAAADRAGAFVPYTPAWNYLGNPAASVPFDIASDGLPVNVQLVGRPGDEETLFSLSAQLEAERPWAGRRPPIS